MQRCRSSRRARAEPCHRFNHRMASLAKRTVCKPTRIAFSAWPSSASPGAKRAWPRSWKVQSGQRCFPPTPGWQLRTSQGAGPSRRYFHPRRPRWHRRRSLGKPVVTSLASSSCPSTLMMTLRSRMKLFVYPTLSSPIFRIFRRRHPRATLGKAAATPMWRTPVTLPPPHAS